jgi:hypothetical protein
VLAGLMMTALGGIYAVYAAYRALIVGATVPGWTSIVFLQVFFSGTILLAIGLIGEYLARIYDESKRRPLYVLRDMINVPRQALAERVVIVPPSEPSDRSGPSRVVAR